MGKFIDHLDADDQKYPDRDTKPDDDLSQTVNRPGVRALTGGHHARLLIKATRWASLQLEGRGHGQNKKGTNDLRHEAMCI